MPTRNRWMVSYPYRSFPGGGRRPCLCGCERRGSSGPRRPRRRPTVMAPIPRRSVTRQIKLVLDHDGAAEQLELADLHEMAVGESRALTTASGTPVVVTRDAQGFEIDLDGKKIRLMDHFAGEGENFNWTEEGGGERQFEKRIVVREGGEGDAGANVMILRNKVAVDGNGAVIADGANGDGGRDVVMMRRMPGERCSCFRLFDRRRRTAGDPPAGRGDDRAPRGQSPSSRSSTRRPAPRSSKRCASRRPRRPGSSLASRAAGRSSSRSRRRSTPSLFRSVPRAGSAVYPLGRRPCTVSACAL